MFSRVPHARVWSGVRTQPEALNLAGFRFRQGIRKNDRPRILVGGDRRFDVIFQYLGKIIRRFLSGHENHMGLNNRATLLIGCTDDRTFLNRRMRKQRCLHFRAGDVVAVHHVLALAVVRQITATGRPAYGKTPHFARRNIVAVLVENSDFVS